MHCRVVVSCPGIYILLAKKCASLHRKQRLHALLAINDILNALLVFTNAQLRSHVLLPILNTIGLFFLIIDIT
jgi:hypothetical protein